MPQIGGGTNLLDGLKIASEEFGLSRYVVLFLLLNGI